jgi:hypothetical protein
MTALCAALGAPAPATAHHVDGHVPDRNVVITPDRTSLTVEAQNYIKAYDAFEDLIWRRSVGTDYEDMAVAKSGLLGRLFAPASSILPFTGAATHTYEVCNPAIRAGCWLFQRTDSDVATYPYSVQRHEAWMSNWPSAAGLWGGYHYPPLARYRALDFWYLSPTNVAHTDCHPAYREAGADWRVLRSTETGAAACRLGVTEYRAMAFLDASPDLARPQADDPAVPNTPWSAYPYSSGWPRSYVTYLKTQDPAVVDRIVQYMAFRIRPDLVESPYPALPR